MTSIPTMKLLDKRNILRSISMEFGITPRFVSLKLMTIIPIAQRTKTNPMRSMNGISYTPFAFFTANPIGFKLFKETKRGRNFNKIEKMNPPMVANKAAFEVVFFQKNPKMNIAKIPGLTNPVYS